MTPIGEVLPWLILQALINLILNLVFWPAEPTNDP
jgi:hypothetical protein